MSDWNKPRQTPKPAPKKPTALRGLIAGAAVVLVALGAVYFFMLDSKPKVEVKKTTKTHRIKEVTPAPAPARTNKVEAEKAVEEEKPAAEPEVVVETLTNGMTSVVKTKKFARISSLRAKNPMFKCLAHSVLYSYTDPGVDVPPPEKLLDSDIIEAITTPIEYRPTDTPEQVERKKSLEMMIKELKKYIKDGGTANGYIAELAHRQELEAEATRTVREDVRNLVLEGKKDEAKAALDTYNAHLQEMGLPTVYVKGVH